MKGVPVRIEIGPRDVEKGEFVAVRRDTSVKTTLKIDTAIESVTELLDDIHDNMYQKYDIMLCYMSVWNVFFYMRLILILCQLL